MRSRWPLILALAVIGLLVLLWRSARDDGDHGRAASTTNPRSARGVATEARGSTAARGGPADPGTPVVRSSSERASSTAASTFDASSRHTADPCTALVEPVVPPGFEQLAVGPITVAWDPTTQTGPFDPPLRPISLAHAVAGILEEAAQLTGTDRREKLTVIVDGSTDAMQQRTRVPAWVGGLYDGGAVHVFAKASTDLGVALDTLRHEIMHAQLHAAVGCTPFWFNEGMASYFEGGVPAREWFAMVRTGDAFDLQTLHDPNVLDLSKETAHRMYAVSLAMVTFLVHRGGEQNLRAAVRIAQQHDSPRDAAELWSRIAPNVEYKDVIESLAQHVFKLPMGPELELVFRGPVCCKQLGAPAETSCRAAQQGELGVSKGYYCRARW